MTAREFRKTTIKNNKPQPQYICPSQQIIGGKNKPIGRQNDYGIGDPISRISAKADGETAMRPVVVSARETNKTSHRSLQY